MTAQVYVIPYLVTNAWMIIITFLQHCHPALPNYNDKEVSYHEILTDPRGSQCAFQQNDMRRSAGNAICSAAAQPIMLSAHVGPACVLQWDWLRGALSTVDRSCGPLLDMAFHHVTETHVCHHLFPSIPHYHAQVGVVTDF